MYQHIVAAKPKVVTFRHHGVQKTNAAGASLTTKGRRGKGISAVAHHAAVSTAARYVLVY